MPNALEAAAERLERALVEVAAAYAAHKQIGSAPDESRDNDPVRPFSLAGALVEARIDITLFLPRRLFADPAYDILLGVYAATERGGRVALTDCALIAQLPATTGHRWTHLLIEQGLLETVDDERDARRSWVQLTQSASSLVNSYLDHVNSKLKGVVR